MERPSFPQVDVGLCTGRGGSQRQCFVICRLAIPPRDPTEAPAQSGPENPPNAKAEESLPGGQNLLYSYPTIRNKKAAQRGSFGAGHPVEVHADIPADVRRQKLW